MPGEAATRAAGKQLAQRVETAIATAAETGRRSRLLRTASQRRRDGALTTRCAWCGRYAVGNRFRRPDETPSFVSFAGSDHVTHGICPDCIDALRREGKSR
jgi:hypothetical protein